MTQRFYIEGPHKFRLVTINILAANDDELQQISQDMGLALNCDEMKEIKAYFLRRNRNPTDVELQTFGQTWSEHCYHKIFKGSIVAPDGSLIVDGLLKSYIVEATKTLNPPWCFSVFEDNAGIVEFDKGFGIAIKVETHNHPSAVEPFGGAATGTGGAIRDVLGVWAEPIACTDVLCFGPLDYAFEKLPEGVKHPQYIFRGVIAGIGFYGNNMGIPTVNGAIFFEEGYVGNPLVYCGCIGLLPLAKYVKNTASGDAVVLVGGKTGSDGIHGVTFASLELTEEAEASRSAVQIANPVEEEKVRRGIIAVRDEGLASGITDLGGGGLSSAVCEMAHRHNLGFHVELDDVPLKTSTIVPWEIWISESQERMLLSVGREQLQTVLDVFRNEDVEATCIGWFTNDGVAKIDYMGIRVAELDLTFLFETPKPRFVSQWNPVDYSEPRFNSPKNLSTTLIRLLSAPNIASKESVIRTYDHEVQGITVLKPLQGRYSGPNDAAVIKPLPNSWKGIAISCGMRPRQGLIDPYWMAASGIDEAIRNNVAVGGRRISLLDNFSWGNPEKPDRLGGLVRAVKACHDFSLALETPFISGKDSLYNESPLGAVTPSLLITGLGIVPDIRRVVSMDLKKTESLLYLVGNTLPELGGSEYYRLKGCVGNSIPKVDALSMKQQMHSVTAAIDAGCVLACHDLSEGGLGVALAEMAFSGGLGVEVNLQQIPAFQIGRDDFLLFSESNSRFLLEVPPTHIDDFETIVDGCVHASIGRVTSELRFVVNGLDGCEVINMGVERLREAWKGTIR
ncbi:MAG: phosphoribosylformylglycinamidine synthase subunit PurL [Candidatus Bathyarchaeia archaeon]